MVLKGELRHAVTRRRSRSLKIDPLFGCSRSVKKPPPKKLNLGEMDG